MQITAQKYVVDPDPFAVASTFIAAAALVLQFLQFRSHSQPDSTAYGRADRLDQLELGVDNALTKGDRLVRSVERGSQQAEQEFFDAPFRVATTQLNLRDENFHAYQSALAEQYASLSRISLWINQIILRNTTLAARIGARLSEPLNDTAARINRILCEGRTNREAVEEGKLALTALKRAIEAELRLSN